MKKFLKNLWHKYQWPFIIFLVIALAIACLFTRCSAPYIRTPDIEKQIDKNKQQIEDNKEAVTIVERSNLTPEEKKTVNKALKGSSINLSSSAITLDQSGKEIQREEKEILALKPDAEFGKWVKRILWGALIAAVVAVGVWVWFKIKPRIIP